MVWCDDFKMSAGEIWLLLWCVMHLCMDLVNGETTIAITTPVNPVRTGNMFAIYCQVWNARNEHEVVLARSQSGITEKISLSRGQLQPDVDERFFLAQRRKNDGSIVYFMSIVDAKLTDEAVYTCNVYAPNRRPPIATASFRIKVQYFPHHRYPKCASEPAAGPDNQVDVYEGRPFGLTCRSQIANPVIQMRWLKLGERGNVEGEEKVRIKSGIMIGELRRMAEADDDGAIFICEISSRAFYGKTETCGIGPINVIPRPRITVVHTTVSTPSVPKQWQRGTTSSTVAVPITYRAYKDPCRERCSDEQEVLFYWSIAAVISFVLCLVFLIMSVILCCKVCTMATPTTRRYHHQNSITSANNSLNRNSLNRNGVVRSYVVPPTHPETVYVKLQRNSNSDRVYMTLEGYNTPESRVLLPKEIYDKYYNRSHMTRL